MLLLLLLLLQVDTLDDAIAMVNANAYGNGTAIFTDSGSAARKFQHDVQVSEGFLVFFCYL
jgi:malonate-semialdehyde dehydrogenase (acetylating)/methylmalonate-semialdehyde dehydrogenase